MKNSTASAATTIVRRRDVLEPERGRMAASSKLMVTEAERRFPVPIRLALPPGGFGTRLTEINAWLDDNCGANGWAMTPLGLRGVANDAVAIYFTDTAFAAGFVARCCARSKVEAVDGVFRLREDAPEPRVGTAAHGTL